MNKFTKMCLLVSVGLAGVGIVFCIVGYALGVTHGDFERFEDDLRAKYGNVIERFEWNRGGIWKSHDYSYEFDYDYDDDDDYDDDYDYGNVRNNGQNTQNGIEFEEINSMELQVNEGTLRIEEHQEDTFIVDTTDINSSFESYADSGILIINDKRKGVNKPEVTVYVPQGFTFDEVEIEIGGGSGKITNLFADSIDIQIGAGELTATGILQANDLSLEIGAGNVDIAEIYASEADINCGVGKAKISGYLYGENEIECGMGKIELSLLNEETDFNYEVKCGIGNVKIGDNSYTSLGAAQKINNGASSKIKVNCGMGKVDIKF